AWPSGLRSWHSIEVLRPRHVAPENGNCQAIRMEPTGINRQTSIDELEVRLAQQEQSINDLSDEVYQQQKQIARLESEVRYLAERLQGVEPQALPSASAEDEIPPHF
ncbi:MAG: SlyX family protein, partial [Gammaproteobacteria bacterium]|nr:SlyX family protein [Gammaproteobacteria bacterium]